jgi:phage baseplate assembly protein W
LFGKSNATIHPRMNGLVARAVLETPQGRQRYRQTLISLLTNCFDVSKLNAKADAIFQRLRPALSTGEARTLETEVAAVKERIVRRQQELALQLSEPELTPLPFEHGVARLTAWRIADLPAGGEMERTKAPGVMAALRIRAGPMTSASWRTGALLTRGRYRFEGRVRTKGVEPLEFGKNQGASLRALGTPGASGHLVGDQDWKLLGVEFEVGQAEQPLDLICELRARRGEAWFDLDSLRLLRLP